MNERRRGFVLALLVVLSATLYFANGYFAESRARHATATVFNDGGGGLSLFFELLQKLGPTSASFVAMSPILTADDLGGATTFALIAPLTPLTEREIEVLDEFTGAGGHLIVSFTDEPSWLRVAGLLSRVAPGLDVDRNEAFANQQTQEARPPGPVAFFVPEERYAFYAPWVLHVPGCASSAGTAAFECFVAYREYGKGTVLALAGLPYFANGMIELARNRAAAARLAQARSGLRFDEFHHLFSNRTIWDLFGRPEFTLPIAGILVGSLLFFLFGHTELHERSRLIEADAAQAPRSFHQLNENLVRRALEEPEAYRRALEQHRDFLARAMGSDWPSYQARAERALAKAASDGRAPRKAEFLNVAATLLSLHREWRRSAGGFVPKTASKTERTVKT